MTGCSRVTHPSATRLSPEGLDSFDLHVLGTPPAFVLSQDQTLQKEKSDTALINETLTCCSVNVRNQSTFGIPRTAPKRSSALRFEGRPNLPKPELSKSVALCWWPALNLNGCGQRRQRIASLPS